MKKKIFWLLFWLVLLWASSFIFAQDTKCSGWQEPNSFGFCKCPVRKKLVDWVCTPCSDPWVCCGVSLNTDVPFIWNCIELSSEDNTSKVTEENAFPTLVAWLTKLLMTVILIVCLLVLIVAWVLWTTWDAKKWKDLIKWVAIALALLWASWVILRLVNPNFFG